MKNRNILLRLEYKGTRYSGWQIQKNGITVQGVISEKLSLFLKEKIRPLGSGRTDAGVHAMSQYANFVTREAIDLADIVYKLNRMLPNDIVVRGCIEVPLAFNARRDARSRSYRYQISENLSAIQSGLSWILGGRLEIALLNEMAGIVGNGSHFHNFCKVKSRKKNNICRIMKSRWIRSGGLLKYEVTADRFLHNMVRLLVGSMVAVAAGELTLLDFKRKLNAKVDDKTKHIAPPEGLYLVDVKYEGITL